MEKNEKKCQIHLIQTEQINKIGDICSFHNDRLAIAGVDDIGFPVKHLYITSDDEIKEGDWYYNTVKEEIQQCETNIEVQSNKLFPEYAKKIIATTDKSLFREKESFFSSLKSFNDNKIKIHLPQPSESFIQEYIECYNKGEIIKEVMVEYYFTHETGYDKLLCSKVDKNNTITVRKIKDSWNEEEVEQCCTDAYRYGYEGGMAEAANIQSKQHDCNSIKNWIKHNIKH